MSLKTTTSVTSVLGIITLIILTLTLNLRSGNIITRSFYEMFSTSFAHPILDYNGTLTNALQFFYLIHQTSTKCRKLFSFGRTSCKKHIQAEKEICLEENFLPPAKNCTVLSFGVGNDLYFEDQVLMAFDCRIHIFDPSVPYIEMNKDIVSSDEETYHPIRLHNGSIDVDDIKSELARLDLNEKPIHLIKIDLWEHEWKILEALLDLGLVEVTQQLTFSSHLSFLKKIDIGLWTDTLQNLMNIMINLDSKGLKKVVYRENRNTLSSILLPGDDIPRPSCGRFLYIRS